MTKHFVTFISPGTFVHEETTKPIKAWLVSLAVDIAKGITERYGAKPFAFYFTTRSRGDGDLDSKVIKTSGRYFLGGRVMTLAEVEKEMPKEQILIGNMRSNGWGKIIVNTNSWRIFQPFDDDDTLIA